MESLHSSIIYPKTHAHEDQNLSSLVPEPAMHTLERPLEVMSEVSPSLHP